VAVPKWKNAPDYIGGPVARGLAGYLCLSYFPDAFLKTGGGEGFNWTVSINENGNTRSSNGLVRVSEKYQ
jgi:hypothetical protein